MARTNKAVDMLAQGQPIYYTGAEDRSYEGGRAAAKTWADYITYEMEHGAYDRRGRAGVSGQRVDGQPGPGGWRARHPAVPCRIARGDQGVCRFAPLPICRRWRGPARQRRSGFGGRHMGPVRTRVPEASRSVAAQPVWRAAVGPED